jgi:hypothetical protein
MARPAGAPTTGRATCRLAAVMAWLSLAGAVHGGCSSAPPSSPAPPPPAVEVTPWSSDEQRLCFSLALLNGKDPILKERRRREGVLLLPR